MLNPIGGLSEENNIYEWSTIKFDIDEYFKNVTISFNMPNSPSISIPTSALKDLLYVMEKELHNPKAKDKLSERLFNFTKTTMSCPIAEL